MNIYQKLSKARVELQKLNLTKTGHNKFSDYRYFELSDFMPAINRIFNDVGLCGVVKFFEDKAELVVCDTEKDGAIVFCSPMAQASLKGAHAIQNLGAVQTYLRRYLWITALEISENDNVETVPVSNKKPMLTNIRFNRALQSVNEGKYTIEKLRQDFDLTDEQETILQDKE